MRSEKLRNFRPAGVLNLALTGSDCLYANTLKELADWSALQPARCAMDRVRVFKILRTILLFLPY